MNSNRIKEIQQTTAYPESLSVHQALLQVWNECSQEEKDNNNIEQQQILLLLNFIQWYNKQYPHDPHPEWLVDDYIRYKKNKIK